jgi:hypothetical protein
MQVNRSTASCHAVYPACLKMFSGGPRGERGPLLTPLQDKPTNLRPPPSLVAARPAVAPPLLSACVGLGMGTQTERSGNGRQGIVSCLCTHHTRSAAIGRRPTESITNSGHCQMARGPLYPRPRPRPGRLGGWATRTVTV